MKTIGLIGGPYDGQRLLISDGTTYTMVFTAKGMKGRYKRKSLEIGFHWEDIS